VQVLMFEQPVAAWMKFVASFAVATVAGLATYGPAMRLAGRLKRIAAGRPHEAEESKGAPVPGP
jgi:hypothetical protein